MTQNGTFTTCSKAKVEFLIPELNEQRLVSAYMHDTPQDMSYDMIIGQDILTKLGLWLDFDTKNPILTIICPQPF